MIREQQGNEDNHSFEQNAVNQKSEKYDSHLEPKQFLIRNENVVAFI